MGVAQSHRYADRVVLNLAEIKENAQKGKNKCSILYVH